MEHYGALFITLKSVKKKIFIAKSVHSSMHSESKNFIYLIETHIDCKFFTALNSGNFENNINASSNLK